MKKYWIFLTCIITACIDLYPNQILDSLENRFNYYKTKRIIDSNYVQLYSEYTFALISADNSKAKNHIENFFNIVSKRNQPKEIVSANLIKAQYFLHFCIYDSILYYINIAEDISLKNNFLFGLANTYNIKGSYYYDTGKYDKSLEYFFKALNISENNSIHSIIPTISHNIARVFWTQNDYKRAYKYAQYAIDKYTQDNNFQGLASIYTFIGGMMISKGMPKDSAEYYLKKGLAININDIPRQNTALSNLSTLASNTGEYHKAIGIENKILETETVPKKRAAAYINLMVYYFSLNKFKESYQSAIEGLKIAEANELLEEQQYLNENLSELFYTQGKYKQAMDYFKKATIIKDSIIAKENIKRYNEINIKYETEKKERKISELNKEKEYQLLIRNTLIIGLTGLIFVVICIVYMYLNKKKLAESLVKANKEISEQKEVLEKQEVLLIDTNAQLRKINLELGKTNYELEQLNVDKNELLGIAAHDLKNPLATISMAAYTIKSYFDKITKEKLLTMIDNIEKTSKRMTDIISNLLDVNAIESGHINIKYSEFNFVEIINDVIDSYVEKAKIKKIEIVREYDNYNDVVYYDESILREIFDNLISNALKFSNENTTVTIKLCQNHNNLNLSVIDEGPGISELDKQKLFSKYAKLSAKPTGGEHSTGLGLSIVKKLANALNSDIKCESELGKGSVFTFIIPKIALEKDRIYAELSSN